MCPGSQERKPHPGTHQTQHRQPAKREDHPAEFSTGTGPPRAPSAALGPLFKKDVKVLERVLRRAPKQGKGLAGMCSGGQLKALGLSGPERMRLRGDLTAPYSFLRRGSGEGGAELFVLSQCQDTWGMAQSCAHQGKFRPDTRKHFFTQRVAKTWNRLPGEAADASPSRACQSRRGTWTVPLKPCFNFGQP